MEVAVAVAVVVVVVVVPVVPVLPLVEAAQAGNHQSAATAAPFHFFPFGAAFQRNVPTFLPGEQQRRQPAMMCCAKK